MKYLTLTGRIATPAAMVVFMTYEISRSMAVGGGWAIIIIIGAALTAVGIEIIGILSGHALEGFWRANDTWRAGLAFALLMIYTGGAVYILRANSVIVPVPVIAAVAYIVSALVESLERETARMETAVSRQANFDLSEAAADREHARLMREKRQTDKTAVQLAKIKHTASTEPVQSQLEPAIANYECPHCGATAGKSGAAFRSQAGLNAHQAHCPARANGAAAIYAANGAAR